MEKSRSRRTSREEGCGRVQQQRSHPKPGPGSDADQFNCYPDHKSSSHRAPGTPIKKLLAEEMSKESGSKRRSPGLIARLMGLDGLPPTQPCQKQQKRASERYLPVIGSAETSHRNGTTSGNRSSRKSSKEEQEFKDVFEVLDMSRLEGRNHSSPGSGTLELTRTEMDFIQRKFVNAKRLSDGADLQDSEEFDEVIEDLDCNKDLLLKFLDQRDTLFSKHLRDLQDDHCQSHCSHQHHGTSRPCSKSARGTANRSRKKAVDVPSDLRCPKHAAESQLYPSKVLFEKDECTALPTRIVVLKPNLGRIENAHRNDLSPRSSYDFLSDCEKLTELPSIMKGQEQIATSRSPEGFSRHKFAESRDTARQISTQLRSGFPGTPVKFSASKSRGYAGDESSSNWSDNESACELEMRTLTSRILTEWSNRYRSSSRSTASSVNKEARKRLSERWKMNHKSIDMGMISRGSTLGEMLSTPDRGVRRGDSDAITCVKGCNQASGGSNNLASRVEPLGISSRDGWKDESIRSLARSRSLPSSSASISSPRRGVHYETLSHERFLIPKEALQRERSSAVKENFNSKHGERSNLAKENFHQTHVSSSKTSRSHSRKLHVTRASTNVLGGTSSQLRFSLIPLLTDITEKNFAKPYSVAPSTPPNIRLESGLAPEIVAGSVKTPATSPEMEVSASTSADAESFLNDLVASGFQERKDSQHVEGSIVLQQPAAESESTRSSKEADQPSPVSVLEPSFPDDVSSSSECFGSLSADLQGLRMQLQLLKLESEEAYEEGPMLVSSDEDTDTDDTPVRISDESATAAESWQSYYITELLVCSGIDDTNPDTYVATCNSMECPVTSDVFEEAEKKYNGDATWLRSDRKLLFDRMNLALRTIYQKFADPHPWSTPASNICSRWTKHGLADSINRLLLGQDELSVLDMVFSTEPGWLDLGDDVDAIGREIERLLTEELVEELVWV